MNAQQRISEAMRRVERASMTLIEKAERLADSETYDSRRWNREYLLQAAREYALAIRHLARVS